jgi:hypothetical protein
MLDNTRVEQLKYQLYQFTGTTQYYEFHSGCVLTDGTHFLAEHARCYWLMDVFASHLTHISKEHGLATLKLVRAGDGANVVIDNGDGQVLATQHIPYTDFPLQEMMLFACWSGGYWVVMLTTEY